MKNIIVQSFVIIPILIIINSCTHYEQVVEPVTPEPKIITNHAPTSATIILTSDSIFINDTVGVSCTVVDPDENETFSYEWASYKATENSTEDNYKFDYWKNNGEFARGGEHALWTPATEVGKYVLFCIASDKGGVQILASKLINAKNGFGITALTDSITYYTDGTQNYTNLVHYDLYNFSNDILVINTCGQPHIQSEILISGEWNLYQKTSWVCPANTSPFGYVNPNNYSRHYDNVPPETGIFRFKVQFSRVGSETKYEYIYTTAFEVKTK
jgi:hypothetical protein